ncbi:MAG: hypothetical protein R2883_00585 [Caldisericia bacterium]
MAYKEKTNSGWKKIFHKKMDHNNPDDDRFEGTPYRSLNFDIDNSGLYHITWCNMGKENEYIDEIFYAKFNGQNWIQENISRNDGDSEDVQMVLDSNGNPNIMWMDNAKFG